MGTSSENPSRSKNSPEGIEYLTEQVTRSCLHRSIDPKHIFFGGEDVGSYAGQFCKHPTFQRMVGCGCKCPWTPKSNGQICRPVPMFLDLMGIATMLINRRANCSPAQSGIYLNLRNLVRHRGKLSKMTNPGAKSNPHNCRSTFPWFS